ncbi:MAG: hypothetical protein DHS20C15_05290 [Planctomycetota bacterium]|nr:MAG: hypothetical protein DHS20C15_05290 [Planctomycetota bacterium]
MNAWWGGLCAVALSQAAGAGLLVFAARRPRGLVESAALAWLTGALFSACVVFVVGALRLPWHPLALAVPHALVAVAGGWCARRRARGRVQNAAAKTVALSLRADSARTTLSTRALQAALALAILLVAAHTLREGARFADSHAVWALRAKVVASDGGFEGSYWREWSDAHDRRAYPPLLSLSGAWVQSWGDALDAAPTKLVNLGFYLALLGLTHAALARRLGARAALAGTALLALSRPVVLGAGWGVADLPLAAYTLAAVCEFARSRRGDTWIAAISLAGAVLCKYEGVWIAGLVLLAASSVQSQRSGRVAVWRAALLPALLGALWVALMLSLQVPFAFGPHAELAPETASFLARLSVAARALLNHALRPQWLFLAPLALVLTLARRPARRTRFTRLGTRVVLALLLVDLSVYAFQAGDTNALLATTLERLLLQVFPLAFVLTLCALSRRRAPR